ncbi:MarR family winged helix-turn-helix transcriptional regulator [Cohnella zeiphila]|uniref:MarR family transcriptional regulator n=1 Tax=Cohnella zeiphila TaxID=2761120 RepID=A0A7X0SKY8_9BACL|nr:MarR family transcriptional regulator [Cohnella zeiphila]MBB6731809.1 MarR family transcriptional regulator [Cohnella zeiphila]
MSELNQEALKEVDDLFRRMVRKFVKERDKISVEGVALPGLMILHKIVRDGEQKLSDLAEQLIFTSGAITAICDKLEKRGFAVRRRAEGDRRAVLLDITGEGRAMIERQSNIGSCSMNLLFAGFGHLELEIQKEIYRTLVRNLEGFSEKILALAKENENRPSPPRENAPGRREEPAKPDRFLTY